MNTNTTETLDALMAIHEYGDNGTNMFNGTGLILSMFRRGLVRRIVRNWDVFFVLTDKGEAMLAAMADGEVQS